MADKDPASFTLKPIWAMDLSTMVPYVVRSSIGEFREIPMVDIWKKKLNSTV